MWPVSHQWHQHEQSVGTQSLTRTLQPHSHTTASWRWYCEYRMQATPVPLPCLCCCCRCRSWRTYHDLNGTCTVVTQVIPAMAQQYGFDYEFVTYKWPHWLHKQVSLLVLSNTGACDGKLGHCRHVVTSLQLGLAACCYSCYCYHCCCYSRHTRTPPLGTSCSSINTFLGPQMVVKPRKHPFSHCVCAPVCICLRSACRPTKPANLQLSVPAPCEMCVCCFPCPTDRQAAHHLGVQDPVPRCAVPPWCGAHHLCGLGPGACGAPTLGLCGLAWLVVGG